jgi:hypothetical protein
MSFFDDDDGVYRTETMISLEESIKIELMHTIFKNM